MKFLFSLVLSLTFFNSGLLAQDGYIIMDSAYINVELKDRGTYSNNRFIETRTGKNITTYYTDSKGIQEFGFIKSGDVYVKKDVTEGTGFQTYFLKRIVSGTSKLYALKTKKGYRFFGEDNGKVIEIENTESFRSTLSNLLKENAITQSYISQVNHSKNSLKRIFTSANTGYEGYFPKFRKGLIIGISNNSMVVKSDIYANTLQAKGTSFIAGGFADIPISLNPRWYTNLQVFYERKRANAYKDYGGFVQDYFFKTDAVHFPILLKFMTTSPSFRFYMKAGPEFTYNFKNSVDVLKANREGGDVIETSKFSIDLLSKYQIGLAAGSGIEFSLNPNNSIGIELRYTYESASLQKGSSYLLSTFFSF